MREEPERGHVHPLRPGRPARLFLAVLGVIWCGLGMIVVVAAFASRPAVAIAPAGLVVLGAAFFYRMLRLSVSFDGDVLVVRNYLATRAVPRSEVAGFGIGAPTVAGVGAAAVVVELRDGRQRPLDATVAMRQWTATSG